jgi:tripartite-type tricarboxylate transporter receptor subunit TctC
MHRRILLSAAAALAAPALARAQDAAEWPARPLRLVVPYLPGGILDAIARLIAEPLQRRLGTTQPLVVENRAGAGGNVGTASVARARGDAHTVLVGNSGPLSINPALARALPFDPQRDFQPVVLVATTPLVLTVPAASPHRTVADFIAWAKAQGHGNGRAVPYGTPGVGTPQHMATELLRLRAGFDVVQVPYQGSAPVITAMLAGDIAFAIENQALVLGQVRAGALRALAVTTPQRSAELPQVPTMQEAGLEGYAVRGWYGLLLPAGVPAAIVQKLNAAAREALREPAVAERLASFGSPYVGGSAEDFATLIAEDITRWRDVAARAKIVLE